MVDVQIVCRSEISVSVTPVDCNHVCMLCGVTFSLNDEYSLSFSTHV